MKSNTWTNLAALLFVFLAMAAAAIARDGRLFGHNADAKPASNAQSVLPDGSVLINTTDLAGDISGYSGPVPVIIRISPEGTVDSVTPLENAETPGFFNRLRQAGLLDHWNGMTPSEALAAQADAVTGATYSSTALIANVKAGLSHYLDAPATVANRSQSPGIAFYAALLVTLAGAIIPLFYHDKRYRLIQQLLNVAILGFWAGTFADYTAMLGFLSNGVTAWAAAVTLLMLAVAFIYPLFGHHSHYCNWICPFGSLQELASRCNPHHKLTLSPGMLSILHYARIVLWCLLMLALWTGFFTSWIDYELFTAFMIKEAATSVLVAGGIFIVLSLFINRPYCRFVCPTGCLFNISENLDTKK